MRAERGVSDAASPACGHCRKPIIGRAFVVGDLVVCGCCSCTLSRRPPGFVGRDYPHERNPYLYEPEKEQHLAIKGMANAPENDPNRIDDSTAARWDKLFTGHSRDIARYDKVNARRLREQSEKGDHDYAMHKHEEQKALVKATEEVFKISAEAVSEKGETP